MSEHIAKYDTWSKGLDLGREHEEQRTLLEGTETIGDVRRVVPKEGSFAKSSNLVKHYGSGEMDAKLTLLQAEKAEFERTEEVDEASETSSLTQNIRETVLRTMIQNELKTSYNLLQERVMLDVIVKLQELESAKLSEEDKDSTRQLETKLRQTEVEKDMLETENKRLTSYLEEGQDKIHDLYKKLRTSLAINDCKESELQELKGQIDEMNQHLEWKNKEISAAAERETSLVRKLVQTKHDLSNLKEKSTRELESSQEAESRILEEKNEIEIENNWLIQNLEESRLDATNLRELVESLEAKVSNLENKILETKAQKQSFELKLQNLFSEKLGMIDTIEKKSIKIERLMDKVEEWEEECERMERNIGSLIENKETLENTNIITGIFKNAVARVYDWMVRRSETN